jgi:hypothetical protein
MPTSSAVKSETESYNLAWGRNTSCYHADQQVKLMNLQAEVDFLLQELQNLKTQRLAETTETEK